MATLVIGIGGTGGKAVADKPSVKYTIGVFIVCDCFESMANDRHNTVQKLSETVVFEVNEKLRKRCADAFQNEISRDWGKQARNEYRSHVNDIREWPHRLNQELNICQKVRRDQIGIFRRDLEPNRNFSSVVDQYKRNIGLFLEILDRAKTARYDCNRILYRSKNDWSETASQSILERRLRRLLQLQNQQLVTLGREVSRWHDTILCSDGICRKTDTTKVCICDYSQRLILPNHMSKLFAFYPKLRTIDGNGQISVMPAA